MGSAGMIHISYVISDMSEFKNVEIRLPPFIKTNTWALADFGYCAHVYQKKYAGATGRLRFFINKPGQLMSSITFRLNTELIYAQNFEEVLKIIKSGRMTLGGVSKTFRCVATGPDVISDENELQILQRLNDLRSRRLTFDLDEVEDLSHTFKIA